MDYKIGVVCIVVCFLSMLSSCRKVSDSSSNPTPPASAPIRKHPHDYSIFEVVSGAEHRRNMDALRSELSGLQAQSKALEQIIADTDADLTRAMAATASESARAKEAIAQHSSLNAERAQVEQDLRSLKTRIAQLDTDRKTLEASQADATVRNQKAHELEHQIRLAQQDLQALQSNLRRIAIIQNDAIIQGRFPAPSPTPSDFIPR